MVKQPDHSGEAKAWCPGHQEKAGGKPSLEINVKKNAGRGIVKCFVCGFGGVRKLADEWGLTPAGKASKLTILDVYPYRDEAGKTLYEVCRAIDEAGEKTFRQRRADPSEPGGYKWSLGRTRRVPYMLPELLAPDADEQVLIVEGEKDVERLMANGFLATTNSEGTGKWRSEWSPYFERRLIVIIPDNDAPGRSHAGGVASMLQAAYSVKILHLPDLPPKGDVSDWFDAGHTRDELMEIIDTTALYRAEATPAEGPEIIWEGSRLRPTALAIVDRLKSHGFFVRSIDGRKYFFDRETKKLGEVSKKENSFEIDLMLNKRYQINSTEHLHSYLSTELEIEAAANGGLVTPRQFAHYDAATNTMYLDMFDGNALKLDGKAIEVRDNGEDGVLFAPIPRATPWKYRPGGDGLLEKTIISSINFQEDESSPYTIEEHRLLMLSWILSIAFESVQPTKPLALAVGPGGSGKSNLFRRIGKMFFGPEYEVDALRKDKEDDFWTKVTSGPFATFDNADTYIPWLPDALAQASTGIQVTKKKLYTNNQVVSYIPKCFISLTARTPTFRREDVASRLLIFYLTRIAEKIAEYQLLEEINSQRDALMSNFAQMLNQVLTSTPDQNVDPNMRLADFATVITRIANAFHVDDLMEGVMLKLRRSQMTFATEENPLYLALDRWIDEIFKVDDEIVNNEGRRILCKDLLQELTQLSEQYHIPLRIRTPTSLGMQLRNMHYELSIHFKITTNRHTKHGNTYEFRRHYEPGPNQAETPA